MQQAPTGLGRRASFFPLVATEYGMGSTNVGVYISGLRTVPSSSGKWLSITRRHRPTESGFTVRQSSSSPSSLSKIISISTESSDSPPEPWLDVARSAMEEPTDDGSAFGADEPDEAADEPAEAADEPAETAVEAAT